MKKKSQKTKNLKLTMVRNSSGHVHCRSGADGKRSEIEKEGG